MTLPPPLRIPFALAMAHHEDLRHWSHFTATVWGTTARRRSHYRAAMATLRLFASLREEAGDRSVTLPGETTGEVVAAACEKYGEHFAELVGTCKVWVNGEPADDDTAVLDTDEVALLPPVSGG